VSRSTQALHLLVAGGVAQLRQAAQFPQQFRREVVQLIGVGIFHGVLELRAAHAIFHRQVLHGLHEERDSRDVRQFRLQPPNHFAGGFGPHVERLQVD
jgi:lipase chaperone LimK